MSAGAAPKLTMSDKLSICSPKALCVLVMRATRPSRLSSTEPMKKLPRGFTLIELLIVMAVIAILALIALPSMQDKLVRDQIIEAAKLADVAKGPVAGIWLAKQALPPDNEAAGLPPADKIVS